MVVNKLRKEAKDEGVKEGAVKVLSKWKDIMMTTILKTDTVSETTQKSEKTEKNEKSETITTSTTSKSSSKPSTQATQTNQTTKRPLEDDSISSDKKAKSDSAYRTGDAVRDKCFEMFVTALMTDAKTDEEADEIILSTAQSIERSLFAEFGSVCPAYKTKFRSKYLNLKDPKNPTLREALIEGMINSDRFIAMTSAVSVGIAKGLGKGYILISSISLTRKWLAMKEKVLTLKLLIKIC